MAFGIVVKPLGAALAPSTQTSTCALATSMPTVTEVTDMIFRSLACACALNQGARNRSGFTKTSAAAMRSVLSHGLYHPAPTKLRAGLAASTAFRLYRAGLV